MASFCFGALEREAADLPESYLTQQGGALLARRDNAAIGFVAWRGLPAIPDTWELKRLWTSPAARGLGTGKALVQAVLDRARAAGKSALVLDTAPDAMQAALQLYLQMGFVPCPCYSGTALPGILYLRKSL